MAGKTAEFGSNMEQIDEQFGSWWTHIISWPCIFGMYSTWMQTEWKLLLNRKQRCLNHVFLLEQMKITRVGKNPRKDGGVVLRHGGSCSKMRWAIAGKQKKWSNFAKFQVLAWMIISSTKRTWISERIITSMVTDCLKKACTWHELGDQTFCGLSTNLQEKLQHGLRLVTDDEQDWFHSSVITQMTFDNIVTWVTRLSIVDWVHFETLTLLATLRTQNQLRRESYVSLEAEQLSPSVGCARNKHQYPTVLQNLKSFRCMLDCEWMDYLPSTFQTWKLKCCVQQTTLQDRADQPKETCARQETIPSTNQDQSTNWKKQTRCWSIVICGLRTHQQTFFSRRVSTFLKTTKHWSKWSSRAEVQRWDTCPEPTELRLIGCSTDWHQKSTCWHANQKEFHAWRVEPSSSFVQYHEFLDVLLQPFQQFSVRSDRKAERMITAKARPVNLVFGSPWSAREFPPQDLDIQSIRGMSIKETR